MCDLFFCKKKTEKSDTFDHDLTEDIVGSLGTVEKSTQLKQVLVAKMVTFFVAIVFFGVPLFFMCDGSINKKQPTKHTQTPTKQVKSQTLYIV